MVPEFLRGCVLIVTLVVACAADVRCRRIPNALIFAAFPLGLVLASWQGGISGLGSALAGVGVASVALLAYAGRMLGAGDVKLLWVIGILVGPHLMVWTLLNAALAGGLLALSWASRHGTLAGTLRNTALAGQSLLATRSAPGTAAEARAGRMPYAPAIALGVLATVGLRHWGVLP